MTGKFRSSKKSDNPSEMYGLGTSPLLFSEETGEVNAHIIVLRIALERLELSVSPAKRKEGGFAQKTNY